jgi:hypothetical protein
MSIRIRITAVIFGWIVLTLGQSPARADMIEFTQVVTQQSTDFRILVSFDKFDSNLGQLNSITFTISGTEVATLRLRNTGNSTSTFTASDQVTLTLSQPNDTALVSSTATVSETQTLAPDPGNTNPVITNSPSSFNVTRSASIATMSTTLFAPSSDLSSFIGTGQIMLPITATASTMVMGSGNTLFIPSTQASAIVKLVYDFTPNAIPEPSSIVLVALGGGACLLVRRYRRRARAAVA